MTKADVLAALAAKPVPFAAGGVQVNLRPLRFGDRVALSAWSKESKDADGSGFSLQKKLVSMSVSDAAGGLLLSEAEVDGLDCKLVEAIADEVARRSGMSPKEDVPGKALPAETPNSPSPDISDSHSE